MRYISNSESSTSAGLKYFLLGGLSSCIILFGAGLIYSYTGLTNLELIYSLLSVILPQNGNESVFNDSIVSGTNLANELNNDEIFINSSVFTGVTLGFLFIFVGFLFKIAAAPLHN